MVDAPCSGEGMFRKNPAVVDSWQEKGPEYFSKLQREIIVQAADMLLPGGMMFYSTCTFSPLENEKTITHLLKERPDMEVIPMEDYEGFAEGLTPTEEKFSMKAVSFAAESGHIRCPERGILWHFFIKRAVHSSKYNRQSRKVLSGGKSAKA